MDARRLPPDPGPATAQRAGPPAALVVASFIPIGFAVVLALVAPGFFAPLLDDRANVFGQPSLIPFAGALLLLLAIDLLVLYAVRSPLVRGLVLAVTTTGGVFLVILAPAITIIALSLDGIID